MVEHAGTAVRSDEGAQERLLGDFRVIFVRFNEFFDVGEAMRLGEATNGEVLSIARGGRRRVVFGDRGVNL